ncbi:MAG TPA: 2-amino-4-hydroxy-6-hydroxymethyldihydropteridine diphosphokinase [Gammaproteobacteria bacterium]
MVEVYVGVGSNIEPERHLRLAVAALEARFGRIRCSSVYRSPSFGFCGADFLNMVCAFSTDRGPDDVERELYDIEYEGGRVRRVERYSSRTLDLDLLLFGEAVDAARRLPRSDVLRYPFVLAPLVELDPALRHPLTGVALADEWRAMQRRGAVALERVEANVSDTCLTLHSNGT